MAFSVAIVSAMKCRQLLGTIVSAWYRHGASEVATTANARPADYGDELDAAMRRCDPSHFVVVGQDDVMPTDRLITRHLRDGTIAALNLIDMEGRRWFDWAYYEHEDSGGRPGTRGSYLQDPAEHHSMTYITGGAQVWSPAARRVASYRGKPWGSGDDMQVCWEAAEAGIVLVPPNDRMPTLVHLERRYPHAEAAP